MATSNKLPSAEELFLLCKTMTSTEVADMYGATRQAVGSKLRRAGLRLARAEPVRNITQRDREYLAQYGLLYSQWRAVVTKPWVTGLLEVK